MSLIHGGDVEGYRLEHGAMPLDFSANINPLGLPPLVIKSLQEAICEAEHYPDPLCRRLTKAIADKEALPTEYILCGNGAADLIFRLVLALRPRRALLPAPTFAEYEQALAMVGCQVEHYQLRAEEGFALTKSILPHLRRGIDIVFLCNPNNPTGHTIEPSLLKEILGCCEEEGITLAVDECFNAFLAEPQKYTLRGCLGEYQNLIILDAFTKIFAMPGLRLGYALSGNSGLLKAMYRAGQPWAVSGLAQAAGLAALESGEYLHATCELISRERPFLKEGLTKAGFRVLGGEANYIFFHSPLKCLAEGLRKQGILIRDCANFIGLGEGYYRVAVKSHADNLRLLSCLAGVKDE